MCGIAGRFFTAPTTPSEASLAAMGRAMVYRGPDDEGVFRAPHIGLVHRRLSIRDLSPAGHCPMSDAEGLVQVVFNGEIYNWRELRAELAVLGHRFGSESDTEVIVQGYRAWGEGVVARLRGMFAIAVWDVQLQRLLLARDRIGEKPLFYRETDAGLDFASTTTALTALAGGEEIDPDAIACYLAHTFIPGNHTVWTGLRVLPPAHVLTVSPNERGVTRRYWSLPQRAPVARRWQDCLAATEAVVMDSVERCLDADVPVGVFLSGGVDSSLIAALAARSRAGLAAFSLGFREQEFSEIPFARTVADHVGLRLHVVEIGVDEVVDSLPHLVVQYGQPFGDASAVPSYLVSRFAREEVKVCLSGDGGDELFGGYWRMQAGVYAARYGQLVPEGIRRHVVQAVSARLGGVGRRWAAMNQLSLATPGAGYTNSESWHDCLRGLAGPRLVAGLAHDRDSCRNGESLSSAEWSVVQRILGADLQVQMPDAYLTKVDVASMAASLEVRAPYLDRSVIEHAWLLPDRMKLHWGQRKWLLKKLAARWVPPEVVYRPKMGFGMPLVHWWRGRLGDWLDVMMVDSVAETEGWIRSEPVRKMLAEHRAGANHQTRLWLVLWLELWCRLVVEQVSAESLPRC